MPKQSSAVSLYYVANVPQYGSLLTAPVAMPPKSTATDMQACKPVPLRSYIVSSHSIATTRHAEQSNNQFTMIWEHAFI